MCFSWICFRRRRRRSHAETAQNQDDLAMKTATVRDRPPYFKRDHCYSEVEERGSLVPGDWLLYHEVEACKVCNPKASKQVLREKFAREYESLLAYNIPLPPGVSKQVYLNEPCYRQWELQRKPAPALWNVYHDQILCVTCNPPINDCVR